MTDIRTLSSEELSHRFWECGKARAKAEREAFYLDEHRKRLLDVLTLQIMKDEKGISHAKASSKARASSEFDLHLQGQAEAIEAKYQAMANYHEVDFEIKRRLNLAFSQNAQRKADGMNT
jgi:hypothetical protein